MVEYLSGNRIQGSSTLTESPPRTNWKLLTRSSAISSTATDIDVSITPKDNMMIICNFLTNNTQVDGRLHFNDNGGSGSSTDYSWIIKKDGSTRSAYGATYGINTEEGYFKNALEIFRLYSRSGQEKLLTWNVCHDANTTGAGLQPTRIQGVGKFQVTSGNITKVSTVNIDSGSYYAGSEILVLGFDNDEADSGTNFWQKLGETTLETAGDNVTVDFTAKKYLMVESHMVGGSGNTFRNAYKLNGVSTGGTYCYRKSSNFASDNTYRDRNLLEIGDQAQEHDSFQTMYIVNVDGQEKLGIMHAVREENDSTSEPSGTECVFKWETTSGQINSITAHNDQTGNFGIGSKLTVYGAD